MHRWQGRVLGVDFHPLIQKNEGGVNGWNFLPLVEFFLEEFFQCRGLAAGFEVGAANGFLPKDSQVTLRETAAADVPAVFLVGHGAAHVVGEYQPNACRTDDEMGYRRRVMVERRVAGQAFESLVNGLVGTASPARAEIHAHLREDDPEEQDAP